MIEVKIDSMDLIDQRLSGLGARLRMVWDFSVPVIVSIKPYQDHRTRSQNNLYWLWLSELGESFSTDTVRHTKDDMHDMLRHKFLGTEQYQIGTEVFNRLPSTKHFPKGVMSQYMEQVEAWATDHGVLLPIPNDNDYSKYRDQLNRGGL